MFWTGEDEDDENLLYSPALIARRASESWIDTLPIEVFINRLIWKYYLISFLIFTFIWPYLNF